MLPRKCKLQNFNLCGLACCAAPVAGTARLQAISLRDLKFSGSGGLNEYNLEF